MLNLQVLNGAFWSIARPAARRSNDALATTTGAVPQRTQCGLFHLFEVSRKCASDDLLYQPGGTPQSLLQAHFGHYPKYRMDINMKWWQIQFPEEETSSTPLAISPGGGKTLIDWMEAIESNKRFPFQYRLSPKMSLDDYIADDLGVPLFSEQVRNIIDELMTGEEGIEWYEVPVVQSRNQYRYFAPKFTRTLDILNEDSSLYGVNKSILIKAVLSTEKIKKYSIVPIVGSSEAFFFPTRIAISDRVKKALKKARMSGISFSPIKVD